MSKELFISSSPHETKVAVFEDDELVEVYHERDTGIGLAGGIYKGRVSRVLPGMQSAFVDIGLDRDAFLYVSDFYEDAEEYDRIVADAEARVTRLAESPAVAMIEAAPAAPVAEAAPQAAEPPATVEPSAESSPGPVTPPPPSLSEAAPPPPAPSFPSTSKPEH